MQEGSNPESNRSLRESNTLNISQLVDHFNILIFIPTKMFPRYRLGLEQSSPSCSQVWLCFQ